MGQHASRLIDKQRLRGAWDVNQIDKALGLRSRLPNLGPIMGQNRDQFGLTHHLVRQIG